jgi:N-formylmaleamate deformylase
MTIDIAGRSVYVNANGLKHHLLVYEGDQGDVLILPGITSPAVTADFIARPISALGYRVYVPDLRGRGATGIGKPGSYRLIDYAADTARLIEGLQMRRPAILGHSLGARIAAAWAVLHAPADRGPLILIDPPTCGPGRGPYPTSRESFLMQLRQAKRGTSAEEVRRFFPKWPQRELQVRADALATCDENAVLETHAGFETEDFLPFWIQIRQPATLIRGVDSPVVPPSAAAELAALNPRVPIISIPGAGHMVPWDNFRGFFETVRSLLS